MAYFECIIGNGGGGASGIPLIVTCNSQFAGLTITATKSGATTQTATCPSSSPYTVEFELPEDGTWTVSGTISGQTFSETVTITPYSASLNAIPDGSTVTPTDDIQTWLHCANIWDKTSYTTISDVLADATTVTALIASSNAVDYMARSTTWATDVCADSSAMTKIGANNYCADALLADSTWRTAICNSTYFESVLNVKVPTMTSNTTPSGVASAYRQNTSAYHVFDGNESTYYTTSDKTYTTDYVRYTFTTAMKAMKVRILPLTATDFGAFKIRASNDGNTWQDLYTGTNSGITWLDILLDNNTGYTQYEIHSNSNTNYYWTIRSAQFYGRT